MEGLCKEEVALFVCHALKGPQGYFDWVMLLADLEFNDLRYRFLRTVRESGVRSTINYLKEAVKQGLMDGPENYKLNTVCAQMKIPLQHHDAESDRRACEEIYCRIARS
jgi:DNA polymerase III epsilon subunit-like protein